MSAIRLARGYTGRPMIVKFAGCYHGHVDSLLVAAGSSAATLGVPNSPGVTEGASRDTLVLRYNDPQAVEDAFAEHGSQIAGVIVEPVVGNMGCVCGTAEFHAALREMTYKHGCAADLRRSDDRLPRGVWRGAIAAGHPARLDHARQDHRRRPAGRRLRRPGRDHGPRSAGRKGVSGGHAQRQSAGHGRRHRHAESSPRHDALSAVGTAFGPIGRRPGSCGETGGRSGPIRAGAAR